MIQSFTKSLQILGNVDLRSELNKRRLETQTISTHHVQQTPKPSLSMAGVPLIHITSKACACSSVPKPYLALHQEYSQRAFGCVVPFVTVNGARAKHSILNSQEEQLTVQSNGILKVSFSHIQIELGCTFLNAQTCNQVTEDFGAC